MTFLISEPPPSKNSGPADGDNRCAPLSKKSALYQEVPKPQHLHEVSVVRFAAACRRCADWLPLVLWKHS
ncbi:hypothetical protein EMIHUDRAFT_240371 [Emiliania huxleyi CCMP1516]|uniref:Uncharacterized protein n=2 Tax=Emiliania huxleyi TaxID=2903 RepID=A0A0D3JFY9_EMIH1|nr:hypothetical protein EMIHUDRAFT_240371 [Emiliania huxleyi CCMP1516]EOD22424.1 hypothetical protein EMIHUDRAFT_240371 [Emiliania huxleyi CCMP1516]|eukprot:XP_005774853.1 hypothetical protein EMIHUDRAFT_240371 [Emiliania huxleyi CCMP1516]